MNERNDGGTPGSAGTDSSLSLFQLTNALIRSRYLLIVLPLVVGFLMAFLSMQRPRMYRASSSFMPNSATEGQGAGLGSIAAQLGISFSTGSPGQSPDFYSELLLTRDILRDAVQTQYEIEVNGRRERGDLVHFFELDDPALASTAPGRTPLDQAIKALRGAVSTDVSFQTGIVQAAVSTENPKLSEAILSRLIALTQDFDLNKRRTQASARRQFAEGQLREARADLTQAQNALEAFVSSNRLFQSSPRQILEQEKLAQEVLLRQTVYAAISQAYEQARMDEVRNTPVITVLETPEGTAAPQSRGTIGRTFTGLVLGLLAALFVALLRESARSARNARDADFEEFLTLRSAVVGDLGRLVGRKRRPRPVGVNGGEG